MHSGINHLLIGHEVAERELITRLHLVGITRDELLVYLHCLFCLACNRIELDYRLFKVPLPLANLTQKSQMLYAALACLAILAVIANQLIEGQISLIRLDGIAEQFIAVPQLGQCLQRLCPMQMSRRFVCVCVCERVKGAQSICMILQLVGIEILIRRHAGEKQQKKEECSTLLAASAALTNTLY